MVNSDLEPITAEVCKEATQKGKARTLLKAYEVASEDHDLAYFKNLLSDFEQALQEDIAAETERLEKKAAKERRKSEAAAKAAQDDEMEVDEGEEKKPKSKKRKKDAGSDGENDKASQPTLGSL